MTREDLKKHWEVIEAFKNGQDVEFWNASSQTWDPVESPVFSERYQYRIAKRDWAWACEMMLAGKKIHSREIGMLWIVSGVVWCSIDNKTGPAIIESRHLLAADYHLA